MALCVRQRFYFLFRLFRLSPTYSGVVLSQQCSRAQSFKMVKWLVRKSDCALRASGVNKAGRRGLELGAVLHRPTAATGTTFTLPSRLSLHPGPRIPAGFRQTSSTCRPLLYTPFQGGFRQNSSMCRPLSYTPFQGGFREAL